MSQKTFERILYVIVGLAVVLRLTHAYLHQREGELLIADTPVPEFMWRDFESNQHSIKELKGKVVVLHFWASWCGPCRHEFPGLLRAAQALGKDAVFLTISSDENDGPARKFLAAAKDAAGVKPDNVLYGFDPMKSLTFDVFQTSALPETIIIDPQQHMRRKFPGMVEWEDNALITYIRDMKNTPAAVDSSPAKVPVPQ